MDTNDAVILKRAKRYIGEIKCLTEAFLQNENELRELTEKEGSLTVEGLREKLYEMKKKYDEQNKILNSFKKKAEEAEEVPSLRSENSSLQSNLKLVKSDMQLLHQQLEAKLNREATTRGRMEAEIKYLLKKNEKQEMKMTQMQKEFENQRLQDAKKLKTYMDSLITETTEKQKLQNEISVLRKELKKKEEESNVTKMEIDMQKQQALQQKEDVLAQHKSQMKDYEEQIEELKKRNQELASIKDASKSEREHYQRMKILCAQYKEMGEENKRLNERLFKAESLLSEYERYKMQNEKKQEKIIQMTEDLQNKQNEIAQLKNQLNQWTSMAKRYIPVDEESENSEGLSYVLLRMHAECQNLTHKKTNAERLCEDMQTSLNNQSDMLKKKELELMDKTNLLESAQNKMNEISKHNENLKNQIKLLEIKLRGEKRISSTAPLEEENKQNEDFENEKKHMEKKIALLNDEILKQKKQICLLQDECKRLEDVVEKSKDLQKNLSMISLEKENLEKVNTELSSQLRKFQDDFRQLKRENERLSKKCFTLEEDMDAKKLHAELLELRHKLGDLESRHMEISSSGASTEEMQILKKEIDALKKQKEDLNRKNAAIREFYTREIKHQREAILYILGWSIKIEKVEGEERYRLSSLYSTHDGELIFYPKKQKVSSEEENKNAEKENVQREFDLYFDGHYATKWENDAIWQSKLKSSGSYPCFLASTCILEMNEMRSNSNDKIFKNSSGILIQFDF